MPSENQSIVHVTREGSTKLTQYRAFVFLGMGVLATWIMFPFLKPLVMGAVFAVVLHPIKRQLLRFVKSSAVRALLVTLLFMFLFVLPVGGLLILGAQKALDFMHNGSANLPPNLSTQSLLEWMHVPELVGKLNAYFPIQYSDVSASLNRGLASGGALLSGVLQSTIAGLPDTVVSGIVMLMTVYFCLVDGHKLVSFLRENSVFDQHGTSELIDNTRQMCQSVINASIIVGLVQAVLMTISALIAGTPNVFLIALITFLASFLPVVGTAPVSIALALFYFTSGQTMPAFVYVGALLVIGVSDNVVRPWVIGGGTQMHPLIAFVSAFGGIAVMGFFGLFLGPILVGVFLRMIPLFLQSARLAQTDSTEVTVTS